MEVHFQNSRDLTGPEALAGGSLIDLISTSAMMSKVLVTGSRTGKSLVRGISSFIQIEKCEYSGLEDTFGSFSQGTVTVSSSTFRNSIRPLIMSTTCQNNIYDGANHLQDCEYRDRTTHLSGWYEGLVCNNVQFIQCRSYEETNPGGAIWCRYKLSLTDCTFDSCNAENGYGSAVFSKWNGDIVFNRCKILNCEAWYSTVHFQCGDNYGSFPAVTMTGNNFTRILIKGGQYPVEGGGSGFVIRHATSLHLKECEFHDCHIQADVYQGGGGALQLYTQTNSAAKYVLESCTFETTRAAREGGGGLLIRFTEVDDNSLSVIGCDFRGCTVDDTNASAGYGGCLMTSDGSYTLTITETTFTGGVAREAGAIYVASSKCSCSLTGCTIDGCEARDRTLSVYLIPAVAVFEGLRVKNMQNNRGQLYIGESFNNHEVTWNNCTFEQFSTTKLFDFKGTIIKVNLSLCVFSGLESKDNNFMPLSGGTIKNLYFLGCTFENVQCAWALVTYKLTGNEGTCVIEDTTFKQVNIGPTDGKYEAILDLRDFLDVTVRHTRFISNTCSNSLLNIGTNGKTCNTVMEYVRFEQCQVNRPTNGEIPFSFVTIGGGEVTVFDHCDFISCFDAGFPLVSLPGVGTISNCVFRDFQALPTSVIHVSGKLQTISLENCVFENEKEQKSSVISFGQSVETISIQSTSFVSLTIADGVQFVSGATSCGWILEDVTLSNCQLPKFVETTGDISVSSGNFTESTIGEFLFSASGTRCTLNNCNFTSISGQKMIHYAATAEDSVFNFTGCDCVSCSATVSSLISVGTASNAHIHGNMFMSCSIGDASVLLLTGVSSMHISGCCFRGTTAGNSAAYIQSDGCESASFELPLCFDLDESKSIAFNDSSRPWSSISDGYAIFNCDNCEEQSSITAVSEEISEFSQEISGFSDEITSSDYDDSSEQTKETDTSGDQGNAGSGLSGGAIAGIVVGILIVIAIVVVIVIFILLRKKKSGDEDGSDPSNQEMETETTRSEQMAVTASEWDGKVTEDNPVFTNSDFNDVNLFEEAIF